jgi:hypothetical protein
MQRTARDVTHSTMGGSASALECSPTDVLAVCNQHIARWRGPRRTLEASNYFTPPLRRGQCQQNFPSPLSKSSLIRRRGLAQEGRGLLVLQFLVLLRAVAPTGQDLLEPWCPEHRAPAEEPAPLLVPPDAVATTAAAVSDHTATCPASSRQRLPEASYLTLPVLFRLRHASVRNQQLRARHGPELVPLAPQHEAFAEVHRPPATTDRRWWRARRTTSRSCLVELLREPLSYLREHARRPPEVANHSKPRDVLRCTRSMQVLLDRQMQLMLHAQLRDHRCTTRLQCSSQLTSCCNLICAGV